MQYGKLRNSVADVRSAAKSLGLMVLGAVHSFHLTLSYKRCILISVQFNTTTTDSRAVGSAEQEERVSYRVLHRLGCPDQLVERVSRHHRSEDSEQLEPQVHQCSY